MAFHSHEAALSFHCQQRKIQMLAGKMCWGPIYSSPKCLVIPPPGGPMLRIAHSNLLYDQVMSDLGSFTMS